MNTFIQRLLIAFLLPLAATAAMASPAIPTYYVRTTGNDADDGTSEATAKLTIAAAITAATDGAIVDVGVGTFQEMVVISKPLTLRGAGAGQTYINGPANVNQTILIQVSNSVVEHVTISRAGNDSANWESNANYYGVAFGVNTDDVTIQYCDISHGRTGIFTNDNTDLHLRFNDIHHNRVGIIVNFGTTGLLIANNYIRDNSAIGVAVYTNYSSSPDDMHVNNNSITGNWYSAIDLQYTDSASTELYDFSSNYFDGGVTFITTGSSEPDYSLSAMPVFWGGEAASPGTYEGLISGNNSTKIDYTPYLASDDDVDAGIGFSPSYSGLRVTNNGAQIGTVTRIQEAVNIVTAAGRVEVEPGTYSENVTIDGKNMTLASTSGRDSTIIQGSWDDGAGSVYVRGNISSLTIGGVGHGFTIMGIDGTAGNEAAALYFKGDAMTNVTVEGNRITANGDAAITGEWNAPYDTFIFQYNIIDGKTFNGDHPAGLTSAAQFTLDNYPRQAIVFGGGAGTTNTKNFRFVFNDIKTITGGMSVTDNNGDTIDPTPHGNYQMTIDALGTTTIAYNTLDGYTLKNAAVRARTEATININQNNFKGTSPVHIEYANTPAGVTKAYYASNNNTFSRMVYADNTHIVSSNIQPAFDLVVAGNTVHIYPGQYDESPTLNTNAHVAGGGSASRINGTLTIHASGDSDASRLQISSFTVVNSTASGVVIGTDASNLTFDGISVDSCLSHGVYFEPGLHSDISFYNCNFTYNSHAGVYIGEGNDVENLALESTSFSNNGRWGLAFNPTNADSTWMSALYLTYVNFSGNGTSSYDQSGDVQLEYGDLSLVGFNGDLSINYVNIVGISTTGPAHIAFQMRGSDSIAPCGAVTINEFRVSGSYARPLEASDGGGQGYGAYLANYTDVSAMSWAYMTSDLAFGNALGFSGIGGYIGLPTTYARSSDGYSIETMPSAVNNVDGVIDASQIGVGRLNATGVAPYAYYFTLADMMYDALDEYSEDAKRAYVRLHADNLYVTTGNNPNVQIQNALDIAEAHDSVHVRAGTYSKQVAPGKYVLGTNGPHKFGLFFDTDSVGLYGHNTNHGMPSSSSFGNVSFTTGATNNFGASGIFVQNNGITISGFAIGNNYNGSNQVDNNKTIEIIGSSVNITRNKIQPQEGAIYIREWDSAGYAEGRVKAYNISYNELTNVAVSVNNGAGVTGHKWGRYVGYNIFSGDPSNLAPYSISFRGWNGASPVQSCIVYPVGGAVIQQNQFNQPVASIVQFRGNSGGYDEGQVDWDEILTQNSYGNNVATLESESPSVVRAFTDTAGYTNTRGITTTIASGLAIAQNNDVVRVGYGLYNESPELTNSTVVVKSTNPGDASLSNGKYFILNATGIGDNNFVNWDRYNTFDEIGVKTGGLLNDAANLVYPDGKIRLFAGTHNITSPVVLDSGIYVTGPSISNTDCDFVPTAVVACTSNTRMFDFGGTSAHHVTNVQLNIGTGTSSRFFRSTSTCSLDVSNVIFKRDGKRLYGMNNAGLQADRDIPKFVDDGNDAGFGSGKVSYKDHAPMNTSSIVAGWKGDDANAAQVASVNDYSGNGLTLTQATLTRKPTRAEVDSNYVITSGVTKYVSANLNATVHGGAERTVFVAFKTPNASAAAVVYKQGDQTDGISVWTNTGNVAGIDITIGGTNFTISRATAANTWYIAEVYFNGNVTTKRIGMTIHGVASPTETHYNSNVIAATSLTTTTNANSVISLGARQGYARRNGAALTANALGDAFTGSIGEVVVLNSASSADRNSVYCMLNSKWKAGSVSNYLDKDDIPGIAGNVSEPTLTNIYPNPANETVSFDIVPAATENIRISIIDMMGAEVATIFNGMVDGGIALPMNHDIANLSSGAYMIVVTGDATRLSMPFLVQH